jgi:hypothetical protein
VEVDDVEDNATFKVAVNAIHPYSGTLVDWQTPNLDDFVVGSSTSKFLTNAPRSLTLGSADRFRLHMLTELASEYEVAHSLRVFDMTSGSESLLLSTPIIIEITAGFAVAVGPADLAGLITVPAKYRVRIIDVGLNPVSENFDFTVDTKCTENRRSFAWLNKFGGVDNYTFTGREIGQSQTKRAAFMRPYAGSGFDFRQRTYRAEPKRTITVSTAMVRRNVRQWLGDDFTESANVIVKDNALWCPAILLSGEVRSYTTGPDLKPFTVEYTTGTDNLSQQA